MGVPSKEPGAPLARGKYFSPWPWEFLSAHKHCNSPLPKGHLPKSPPRAFSNSSGLIRAPDLTFELEPDEALGGLRTCTGWAISRCLVRALGWSGADKWEADNPEIAQLVSSGSVKLKQLTHLQGAWAEQSWEWQGCGGGYGSDQVLGLM